MPVSEAVRRLCDDPGFWAGTLAGGTGDVRASFPVVGGYALVLDVDRETGERRLGLRRPGFTEPDRLAAAPAGGPYPAALHWWELDLCARVIAWEDPTLPHPGLVVALVSPFAPATDEDEAMRETAYRRLRRDVPAGREQTPLPLFTSADWWPAERPELLDAATIAALSRPAPAIFGVREGEHFPLDGLADLVRKASAHLRARNGDGGAGALARTIVAAGDLARVPELLAVLTEAGCDHPTVLDALSEPLVAAEACWMLETLAGAEPGALLRRQSWRARLS